MKRFTVVCDFGGQKADLHIYVGEPSPHCHPLRFQSAWLESVRGGTIPPDVMETFAKLQAIALENNVSFEELCVSALGTVDEKKPATPS
jgi:hypothetical protein